MTPIPGLLGPEAKDVSKHVARRGQTFSERLAEFLAVVCLDGQLLQRAVMAGSGPLVTVAQRDAQVAVCSRGLCVKLL